MNLQLKTPTLVPPPHAEGWSGYEYRQPETGAWLDGRSLSGTVEAVRQHRLGNTLPRATTEECDVDVQNQLCQRLGAQWCNHAERFGIGIHQWDKVIAGTRALAGWALSAATSGNPYVGQEEATRRAAICARCFLNQRGGGCLSCGFFDMVRGLLAETTDPGTTPYDDRLEACGVCECLLRKKVWLKAEIIAPAISERQLAIYQEVPQCWMAEISPP